MTVIIQRKFSMIPVTLDLYFIYLTNVSMPSIIVKYDARLANIWDYISISIEC